MKNLIKYKNRIYRKYATDLWGQVIMKGKITRMFKFLMQVFHVKLKKIYLRKNFTRNKFYKKKLIKRLNLNSKRRLKLLPTLYKNLENISNSDILKENFNLPDDAKKQKTKNEIDLDESKEKAIAKYYRSVGLEHLREFHSTRRGFIRGYKHHLSKWKFFFLSNLNKIYFSSNKFIKKKLSLKNYLKTARRSTRTRFFRTRFLSEAIRILKLQELWKGRKKRTLWKMMDESYDFRNKINSYTTWLDCVRRFKAKKFTNWWKLRGAIRKISIFYGIMSLKKFRYIENSINRRTLLRLSFAIKLETMLNIILFRINLFSNIYFANNFIRGGGLILNSKKIIYPYKFMRTGDILIINKCYFKKIFNIFFKKLFFSKSMLVKKHSFFHYHRTTATKLLLNHPNYIEINYKILHAILWRLPKRSELSGLAFSSTKSIYDWSVSTEVDYQ